MLCTARHLANRRRNTTKSTNFMHCTPSSEQKKKHPKIDGVDRDNAGPRKSLARFRLIPESKSDADDTVGGCA